MAVGSLEGAVPAELVSKEEEEVMMMVVEVVAVPSREEVVEGLAT